MARLLMPLLAGAALRAPVTARAAITLATVTTAAPGAAYVTHAHDGRLFIVQLDGHILIYDRATGTLLPTPFLDVHAGTSPLRR